MRNRLITMLLLLFLVCASLSAQELTNFVNYGRDAQMEEGDDDFIQIFFIQIDKSLGGKHSLEIFDLDCGGLVDTKFGELFNTEFSYKLFGGSGIYSPSSIRQPYPDRDLTFTGKLLWSKTIGNTEESTYDDKWVKVAEFEAQDGEDYEGKYYFKLVVEGIDGNDANVFNLRLDGEEKNEGIRIFSYSPTLRLPERAPAIHIPFYSSDNERFTVFNFDGDKSPLKIITPYRSNMMLTTSEEGKWLSDGVKLLSFEKEQLCAIEFGPGLKSSVNDATFYIKSQNDYLPFEIPIYSKNYNSRPNLSESIYYTTECRTLTFDASNSSDNEDNDISYKWLFKNNELIKGEKITQSFPLSGKYKVTLLGTDNSGKIENSSYKEIDFSVNEAPSAISGSDVVTPPNEPAYFNGSQSFDDDGYITKYEWDFGNGERASGKTTYKAYSTPGKYKVYLKVTDNSNSPCNFDLDSLEVWVNAAPVAKAGNDLAVAVGEEIDFSASESYDPDGKIKFYRWDLGDGTRSGDEQLKHSYSKPGRYDIVLTVTDETNVGNKTSSDRFVVTVNDPPVADAGRDIVSSLNEELAFDAINSKDPDGEIVEYIWDFADGTTSEGKFVTHSYDKPGNYNVILKVKDNSCTSTQYDTDEKVIIVNDQPLAVAGSDVYQTLPEVYFDASSSQDNDGQIRSYIWDFGDGTTSNEITTKHVYRNPGTYTASVKVTDNTSVANNNSSDFIEVKINAKPIADAGPDVITSPGENIYFSADNSVDPDGIIESYEWSLNDSVISSLQSFNYIFSKAGIYNVNLMVKDNSGHNEAIDFDNVKIVVNNAPVAVTTKNIFAAPGDIVKLDAGKSSDKDGNIVSYEWTFEDGRNLSGKMIEQIFTQPGIYKTRLNIKDNSNVANSLTSEEITIHINNSPLAKTKSEILTCSNFVELSAEGSTDPDDDKLIYKWLVEDNIVYGKIILHKFKGSGVYPVILEIDDGLGLKNSKVNSAVKVVINTAPVANAGPDELVCSGDVVNFSGSESYDEDKDLLKYYWDFGNGSSSEGVSVTNIFTTGGVYEVTLKVTDNSGLDCNFGIDKKIVTVVESPVAFAGEDITACTNSEVFFDGSNSTDSDGIVNNFTWDFGDGEIGGGAKASHIYKRPGTYKVLLAITGELVGECDNTDTDELIVTITDAPLAMFDCADSVAVGTPVTFDASSSEGRNGVISKYKWDLGDGNTASDKVVEHTYAEAGNYKVSLIITTTTESDCNTSVFKKSVNVNLPPVAEAGDDLFIAEGEQFTLDASKSYDEDGKVTEYKWDLNDGSDIKEGVLVSHSYSSAGKYRIKLTVKDNTNLENCYNSDVLNVIVNAAPFAVINAPDEIYVNQVIKISGDDSFDEETKQLEYSWTISDGTSYKTSGFQHQFSRPGEYEILLQLSDDAGLSNSKVTVSKFVKVFEKPEVKIIIPNTVCINSAIAGSVEVKGAINPDNLIFNWKLQHKLDDENNSRPTINFDEPGLNELKLELYDNQYPDQVLTSDSTQIFVNRAPKAAAVVAEQVVIGGANDEVIFDGSSSSDPDNDALTYEWNFGDNSKAFGKRVFHKYLNEGIYNITLTVSDNKNCDCNSSTVMKIINVRRAN